MSDGERRELTTLAVPDLVSLPRIEGLNKKFKYEDETGDLLKILDAISDDNKEEFLRLLFKWPRLQTSENISIIAHSIVSEGATKCATSVFDGETNGIINPDVEYAMTEGRWTVIHTGANLLDSALLALFFQRGFSADIRCDWKMLNYKQVLPLNLALRRLRRYNCIGGLRSVGNLLKTLCEKAHWLKAVTLLALNTTDLKQEFFNYAKKGKWVEVGALLLAAGEKLMPLCISEGEDDVTVFNSFKEISHFLQAKYPWSTVNFDETKEMRETLLLLDIYDKIGNQLTAYARPKEAPKEDQTLDYSFNSLLLSNGFDVFYEDLCYAKYLSRRNTSVYQFPAVGPRELEKFFNRQCPQPSIATGHSFHTSAFRNIDSKFASLTPAAKKSVNVMQNLNSCNRWVPFMNIFRRGVRRV